MSKENTESNNHFNNPPSVPWGQVNFDPASLLASIPAILGFYPHNSLVVLGFSIEGAALRLGPTLRADLLDNTAIAELYELLMGAQSPIDSEVVLAFLITEAHYPHTTPPGNIDLAAARVISDLETFAAESRLPLAGIWLTQRIRSGERFWRIYQAEHLSGIAGLGGTAVQLTPSPETGFISEVMASAAGQRWLNCGSLPELSRQEAVDALIAPNPYVGSLRQGILRQTVDSERTTSPLCCPGVAIQLADAAIAAAQRIVAAVAPADAFDDLRVGLLKAAGNNKAMAADLGTVARAVEETASRDILIDWAGEEGLTAAALMEVITRTFGGDLSGDLSANALCLYAVATISGGLPMKASLGLSAALSVSSHHRLASLMLQVFRSNSPEQVVRSLREIARGLRGEGKGQCFCQEDFPAA